MKRLRRLLLPGIFLLAVAPVHVRAQIQDSGSTEVGLRAFNGREGLVYSEFALEKTNWFFRAVGAKKSTSVRAGQATLLHGGSDVEQGITRTLQNGTLTQLGLAIADTGAQRQGGFLTARARKTQGVFSVEPRLVLGKSSFLGVRLEGTREGFTASITPVLLGKNGVNPQTGAARQTVLWELSARRGAVTLGTTNALGSTTGMSLSPALSGSAIFLKVRQNL